MAVDRVPVRPAALRCLAEHRENAAWIAWSELPGAQLRPHGHPGAAGGQKGQDPAGGPGLWLPCTPPTEEGHEAGSCTAGTGAQRWGYGRVRVLCQAPSTVAGEDQKGPSRRG